MKRSPLRRKTSMKRRSNPTKRAPRRVGREDANAGQEYMARVRLLACCAPYEKVRWPGSTIVQFVLVKACSGAMHAHHAGRRPGVGLKCSDFETVPLCAAHHDALHGLRNEFKDWDKARLRRWSSARIAETQRTLGLDPTRAGTSKEGK